MDRAGENDVPFAAWVAAISATLAGDDGGTGIDVPCGSCTACCTSSQFVHIGPDETATLARVPKALRFPAPRMPAGHVLLPYDEHGRCPMLVDGRCSVYDVRPRACRTYDCRVFAASGVHPGEDKPGVAAQVARWRIRTASADDRARLAAIRAAAGLLAAHPDLVDAAGITPTPTQLAVLAVEIHDAFLAYRDGSAHVVDPPVDAVRLRLRRALQPRAPGAGGGSPGK